MDENKDQEQGQEATNAPEAENTQATPAEGTPENTGGEAEGSEVPAQPEAPAEGSQE